MTNIYFIIGKIYSNLILPSTCDQFASGQLQLFIVELCLLIQVGMQKRQNLLSNNAQLTHSLLVFFKSGGHAVV